MALTNSKPALPLEGIFASAWVLQIYFGLYFQSHYPIWLTIFSAGTTVLLVVLSSEFDQPQITKIVWVGLAAVIAMAMPALFSRMPVQSYSWSFYLLAGGFALLMMRVNVAKVIFWSLVLYVLADTVFAYYQMLGLGNTRPGGLFMDSNVRAIYVLSSILFLTAQAATTMSRGKSNVLWLVIFILMVGFHSTQSRALFALAILSLSFIWVYSGFMDRSHLKNTLRLTAIFIVGFLLYSSIYHFAVDGGSSLRALEDQSKSFNVRKDVWLSAWQLIIERPLVGHGFGLFQYLYPSIRTELGTSGFFVHNDYLQFWLESGVLGLILTLLPGFYFLFKVYEAYRFRRFQQLLYSGIGLCFMGFAFFNYFFWRFENLLVFAAVWKLIEFEESTDRPKNLIQIKGKHRFIALLLFALPVVNVIAKVDEARVAGIEIGIDQMHTWSDVIIGDESSLLPMRARWYFIQAMTDNNDAIDFHDFNYLIAQLNAEITRGTLYPAVYCARGEIGYLLNEPYDTIMGYIGSGKRLDSRSIYCQYARFNIDIASGNKEQAVADLKEFLSGVFSMQHVSAIIELNSFGLKFAESQDYSEYISFFTQYGTAIEQRKIELGME